MVPWLAGRWRFHELNGAPQASGCGIQPTIRATLITMGDERDERAIVERVRDALAHTDATVDVELIFECPVEWEQMRPIAGSGDAGRRCDECRCTVYDFTSTPKADVVNLIHRSGGVICGQVRRRSDGRIVFGNCTRDLNVRPKLGVVVLS